MTLSTGGIRDGRWWRASVGAWANRARVVRGAELRTKEQQRRRRGVKRGDLFFFLATEAEEESERPENESELGFRSNPDRAVWTGLGLVGY